MDKYTIIIKYITENKDSGYYLAYIPDFGHSACSAPADTREDAIKSLKEVYKEVIKHYYAVGKTIPMPIIRMSINDVT